MEKNLPKGKSIALAVDIEVKLVLPNYSFGFPGARSHTAHSNHRNSISSVALQNTRL